MKRAALEMLAGLWVVALSPVWVPLALLAIVGAVLRALGRCYICNHIRTKRELYRWMMPHTQAAISMMAAMDTGEAGRSEDA